MLPVTVSPLPLRTARLVLRQAVGGDAARMLEYYGDPQVVWFTPIETLDAAGVAERLERYQAETGLVAAGDAIHVMAELDGALVGDVLLRLESAVTEPPGTPPSMAEIGWIFHPAYAGRGLATEAARAVLGLAFDHYGLRRVSAQLDPRNVASARVCERLGMVREALLRQDWWGPDEWSDTAIYSVLATDPRP